MSLVSPVVSKLQYNELKCRKMMKTCLHGLTLILQGIRWPNNHISWVLQLVVGETGSR